MTDFPDELRMHRALFIHWRDKTPLYQAGHASAKHLAEARRVPSSVSCITRRNVPEELSRASIVTERSGSLIKGGVVLVYCPNYKLLSKLSDLRRWAAEL